MAVPPNSDLPRVASSAEFNTLVEHVKRELQVSVSPNFKRPGLTNGSAVPEVTPSEYSFKFRCQRSNTDFLLTAREMLEQFLQNHNIHVYPSPTTHTHKRNDSFAEAFPHFESKILSTARARGHGKVQVSSLVRDSDHWETESMDMGRSDFMAERRLRMANSSPDVKALFNSPAYIYNLEAQGDGSIDSTFNMVTPVQQDMDYWTPLAPIVRILFTSE